MRKRLILLVSLFIVSLVGFSSATYAMFTKQLHPEIDGLTFNVATQDNIMISTSGKRGTFEDEIAFKDLYDNDVTLRPLKGVVNENNISFLKDDVDVSLSSEDFIKIPLYFSSSTDMDVYLNGSEKGTVIDIIKKNNDKFDDDEIEAAADCIRIGFLVYSTNEVVTNTGVELNYEPIKTFVYSDKEKTNADYKNNNKTYDTFNKSNIGFTNSDDDVVLFKAEANKIIKMDVFIWLESEDVKCDISVFDASMIINLKFFGNKVLEGDN